MSPPPPRRCLPFPEIKGPPDFTEFTFFLRVSVAPHTVHTNQKKAKKKKKKQNKTKQRPRSQDTWFCKLCLKCSLFFFSLFSFPLWVKMGKNPFDPPFYTRRLFDAAPHPPWTKMTMGKRSPIVTRMWSYGAPCNPVVTLSPCSLDSHNAPYPISRTWCKRNVQVWCSVCIEAYAGKTGVF